jgi:hypothetical protein
MSECGRSVCGLALRDCEGAILVMQTDSRIALFVEALKIPVVDPLLLEEFERLGALVPISTK